MGDPTAANVTVEASNGVRLRQGTTDMIVLDASGNSYFAGVMTIGTSGEIRQGRARWGLISPGCAWRDSNVGRIGVCVECVAVVRRHGGQPGGRDGGM